MTWYSTVQYSTVQYNSTVQYITTQTLGVNIIQNNAVMMGFGTPEASEVHCHVAGKA